MAISEIFNGVNYGGHMNYNFENKTVLITGAAGFIGRCLAKSYGDQGANLILIDLPNRLEGLGKIKEKVQSEDNKVHIFGVDICNLDDINQFIEQLNQKNLFVDVLVNNAGYNELCDARNLTEQTWDYVVDVNLKGTFFLTKEIVNHSLLKTKGNIVCISSQHGIVGNLKRAHYCASKGGLNNMVKALAYEWAKYKIRVNCVAPTFVITEGNKDMLNKSNFIRQNKNKIPLGSYAEPEDVANATIFLSSDYAKMITGHNLIVDGGYTIH